MKPYNYVAVVGIDGMGNFNRHTATPCMDRIFADGACTYDAYSMDPTISAENWGGMLIGADPAVHGLTNGYISCHPYANAALPTVFYRIRAQMPNAYLASVVNWTPINIGIAEDGLHIDKRTADTDADTVREAVACIAEKPTFLFVQLDEVDGAGHHFGYGTDGHLQKITQIDALVGTLYDAYARAGIAEETLFLCIADHGGEKHSHGGWSETEKFVFLAAAGRDVPHGSIGFAVTKDIAAIVLHALGMDVPPYTPDGFSSQVPTGIFRDACRPYMRPQERPPVVRRETVPYDAPNGLGALFGDRVRLCLFFDNDVSDEADRCAVKKAGHIKYYSNGVRGAAAEFGATGALSVDGLSLRDSFTFCFWILADADLPEAVCVLGNKTPERGMHREKGFNVLLRNHSVMVQFGCGDDDTDTVTAFGTDGFRGWLHVALSFSAATGETRCYLDFCRAHTEAVADAYLQAMTAPSVFVVGDDTQMRFNASRGLVFRMDDLLVLDGAAEDADILRLQAYYAQPSD